MFVSITAQKPNDAFKIFVINTKIQSPLKLSPCTLQDYYNIFSLKRFR